MASFWERREERRQEWEEYSSTPANRRLRHVAIGSIILAALLSIAAAFTISLSAPGESPGTATLLLRILAGVFASAGAILILLLAYRVHSAALRDRWNPRNTDRER